MINDDEANDATAPGDVLLGSSSRSTAEERALRQLDPVLPADAFVRAGLPLDEHGDASATGCDKSRAALGRRRERQQPRRERARDEEVLPRGAIVDKYRIEGLVGKGGFAAVYRATHLLLGTRVAIKLLRPRVLERQPTLTSLLCEEARFAACIDHPNVVRILDVTSGCALTYIVMEYIDGQSLGQLIVRNGPLAPPTLLRVGIQIAAGLRAGLEQRLIHRDVKPANILLTKSGDAKLVDFGLALPSAVSDVPRARSGSIIGTCGYMSPEQADDPESVDFRADIYSLGVTLYEAATGAPPFPLGDPSKCMLWHKTQAVPPPETRVPGFPTEVSSLLRWMLAKDPLDRPGSYELLSASMQKVLAAIEGRVVEPPKLPARPA
jgi:serine/threonine-protein kinase